MKINLDLLEGFGNLKDIVERKFSKDLEYKPIESDIWIVNNYNEKIHIVGVGQICCFWGPSKSGKSITLELIASAAISSDKKIGNIYSSEKVKDVLFVDLEQSESEWQTAMYRILSYTGLKDAPDNLVSISTKTLQGIEPMEGLFKIIEVCDNIDLLIIDGFADLCESERDPEIASRNFQRISSLAEIRKFSVITIIHSSRSKFSEGPRDHLGVKAEKFCTALPEIIKDDDTNSFLIGYYKNRNSKPHKPVRFLIGDNKMVEFDGIEHNPMVSGSYKVKNKIELSQNDIDVVENLITYKSK